MRQTEEALRRVEAERKDFEIHNKVFNVDQQFNDKVKQLTNLQDAVTLKEINRESLAARIDRYRKEYGGGSEKSYSETALADPAVQKLRAELVDNELETTQRGLLFNESKDLELQNLKDKQQQLRDRLVAELKRMSDSKISNDEIDLFMLECEIDGYHKAIGNIEGFAKKYPEERVEYYRILRELGIQESLYKMLRDEYEKARIEEARSPIMLRVLDEGVPPLYRTRPKLKVTLAATMCVSFFMGVYLVLFLEYLRRLKARDRA
jgi:uncharacterized protein involved in exopolysaccharide biosynthesis